MLVGGRPCRVIFIGDPAECGKWLPWAKDKLGFLQRSRPAKRHYELLPKTTVRVETGFGPIDKIIIEAEATTSPAGLFDIQFPATNRKRFYPARANLREWTPLREWAAAAQSAENIEQAPTELVKPLKSFDKYSTKYDARKLPPRLASYSGMFSGTIRKVVAKLLAKNAIIPFSPRALLCHGVLTPTGHEYKNKRYIIEITSSDVYWWPVTFGFDSASFKKDNPNTKLTDLPLAEAERYMFELPKKYKIPDQQKKRLLGSVSSVWSQASPLFTECGWAFSKSGLRAANIAVGNVNGARYMKLYEIVFSTDPQTGEPTSMSISVVEEGYYWSSTSTPNFKIPFYALGVQVSFDPNTTLPSITAPLGESATYTAPIYCWYSGEELQVIRYQWSPVINSGGNVVNEPKVPGFFGYCGGYTDSGSGSAEIYSATGMNGISWTNEQESTGGSGFLSSAAGISPSYTHGVGTVTQYRLGEEVSHTQTAYAFTCPISSPYGNASDTGGPLYFVVKVENDHIEEHRMYKNVLTNFNASICTQYNSVIIPFFEREAAYHYKRAITTYTGGSGTSFYTPAYLGEQTVDYYNRSGDPESEKLFTETNNLDYFATSWISNGAITPDQFTTDTNTLYYLYGDTFAIVNEDFYSAATDVYALSSTVSENFVLLNSTNGIYDEGGYMAMKESFRFLDRAGNMDYPTTGYDPDNSLFLFFVGDETPRIEE
jgi:hypothetical protein